MVSFVNQIFKYFLLPSLRKLYTILISNVIVLHYVLSVFDKTKQGVE